MTSDVMAFCWWCLSKQPKKRLITHPFSPLPEIYSLLDSVYSLFLVGWLWCWWWISSLSDNLSEIDEEIVVSLGGVQDQVVKVPQTDQEAIQDEQRRTHSSKKTRSQCCLRVVIISDVVFVNRLLHTDDKKSKRGTRHSPHMQWKTWEKRNDTN